MTRQEKSWFLHILYELFGVMEKEHSIARLLQYKFMVAGLQLVIDACIYGIPNPNIE
jgi:hypothetical protein